MEQNYWDAQTKYQKYKRVVILAALLFSVVIGPFTMISKEGSFQSRVIDFVDLIAVAIITYSWCYFDSLERNQPVTRGLRVLIVLLGVIGLCIYLFKSRGGKQGLISSAKALGVFVVMVMISVLSGAGVVTVLDLPIADV